MARHGISEWLAHRWKCYKLVVNHCFVLAIWHWKSNFWKQFLDKQSTLYEIERLQKEWLESMPSDLWDDV